jgi:preprotein translocase subunit SecA
LRGRAGRHGDPGSSQFYVSLEDDLMRLFGSERIAGMMDKLGFKEGEMLEASMLSKSVERAQKKVEENNFGIRKRLLEYDDVMNNQRSVIYTRRRHALIGERIGLDVLNMLYDTSLTIAENFSDTGDYEGLKFELFKTMAIEAPVNEEQSKGMKTEALADAIVEAAIESFKRKTERMTQVAQPNIERAYREVGDRFENIIVPITDGKKIYNINCHLKTAVDTGSKEVVKAFEKSVLLHSIDESWKEHLREMDELRHSVQNASYENKDPLLIYKLESYNLFKSMVEEMNKKAVSILMRGQIYIQDQAVREAAPEKKTDYSNYRTQKDEMSEARRIQGEVAGRDTRTRQITAPIVKEKTVGRNDPCPCGSGKKYKNCCGK